MRCLVVLAYALPAAIVWMLLGLGLTALPLAAVALVGVVGYGGYYGFTELTGSAGLAIPGRRWQVPQTMMINASPPRRVLVWGAILGPGLLTRNPYAGFGLLPIVLAAMSAAVAWGGHSGPSWRTGLAVGAAIGLAHGSARAIALLRDIAELHRPGPADLASAAAGPAGQLDFLLKIIYWRRLDGSLLLAVAATGAVLLAGHVSGQF